MSVYSRFTTFALIVLMFAASLVATMFSQWFWPFTLALGALTLVGVWDLAQTRHSIRRNYPVIGHFRFLVEAIRPELRQYLFAPNEVKLLSAYAQFIRPGSLAEGRFEHKVFEIYWPMARAESFAASTA